MARLLIVDDDEEQRILLQSLLKEQGHHMYFASDGDVALHTFRGKDIDVVITDLAMPKVNGLRLIKELRKVDPDVRVIAISGVARDQLLLAEDYGALAILTKPVDRDDFMEALKGALQPRGHFGMDGRWHQ